jgi:hypothetical protein
MPFGEIYVPLYVGFARDPKVRRLLQASRRDGMAAAYLYLMMACYCREELTDGFVPTEQLGALAYPVGIRTARRLVDLLLDEKLIQSRVSSGGGGWVVLAYVKRNGTRADAEKRADQSRSAARARWNPSRPHSGQHATRSAPGNAGRNAGGSAPGNADGSATRYAKSESIQKESSVGVVDPRAPAPARARADDDDQPAKPDDDDLDGRIVIMLAAHGYTISREQARGVRLRIIGGRRIADPGRYISAALATIDGAHKWAPAPAVMPPRGLDPVTSSRAARLRQGGGYEHVGDSPWQPQPEQPALDDLERADTAHRGGDAARKLLADRERPESVPAAMVPRELHGPALAASQAAESRAGRGAPLTVEPVTEDVPFDEPPDEPVPEEADELDAYAQDDDPGDDDPPPF